MSESHKPEEAPVSDLIHRKLAASLFNSTWDLIEKPLRTPAEDDLMIGGAHASLYHWSQIAGPEKLVVGQWQVAHVYTIIQHTQEALFHAARCLDICTANTIGDWRLAFAYEAIARAHAAAGDAANTRHHRHLATEAGEQIAETGDRQHFQTELAKGPWFGIE